MKIAILGGGHGAYAAAADLSEAGHEVRLWRRDAATLTGHDSIVLKDAAGSREVPLACATADIGAALRGAELIVLPTPATRRTTSPAPWRRTSSTARSCSWRPAPSAAT